MKATAEAARRFLLARHFLAPARSLAGSPEAVMQVFRKPSIVSLFDRIGFRVRSEPWNRTESTSGRTWAKLVFAPPADERASNVHVRENASETARRNLLFRDFLQANAAARDAWSDFKQRLALIAPDIYIYGQAKAGPTEILMIAAESWAAESGWTVPPQRYRD